MTDHDLRALDRHALVMAIWLAFGFVAAMLFEYGLAAGGWPSIAGGFASVVIAFIGHIIVNTVLGTSFTPKEVALGLVSYLCALVAFGVAVLVSPAFSAANFLAIILGLIALPVVVIFYMVTNFGVLGAFEAFDVIRRFRS
jgi:hypothetical protein